MSLFLVVGLITISIFFGIISMQKSLDINDQLQSIKELLFIIAFIVGLASVIICSIAMEVQT